MKELKNTISKLGLSLEEFRIRFSNNSYEMINKINDILRDNGHINDLEDSIQYVELMKNI